MKTLLLKNSCVLWFLFAVVHLPAQVNLTNGLVAYYPLNGNANDFSGNNNNGSPFDNVTYITDPFGNASSAVSFGGTTSQGRISIPHSATLNFTTGATFSFWARVSSNTGTFGNGSVGAGGSHCFFAKAGDAGGGFWQLSNTQSGNLRHQIGNNSVAILTGIFENYTLNQWIHYVVTMDASGHRTYINGVLQTTNTIAANFTAMANRPLVIGRFNTNWYPLNGGIDEFRVYNRVLTTDEITALATNVIGDVAITYANPGEVCAGSSLEVSYQATGSFLSTNQFQVQLSDRNGSFANPIVLRRVTGTSVNETATVVLPAGLPSGTQYRIRLATTAPQEFSASGLSFTVKGTTGDIPDPTLFTYIGNVNGRDYFRSITAQNRSNARTICLNNGGHLASIPNAEVNQFIFDNAGNSRIYIGLQDSQTEGVFVWENGERLTYTNWSPGEPNNSSNEDLVELDNTNGRWNDTNGSATRLYFLELNPAGALKTVCEGSNLTLQAPTLSGATYVWTGPNGFSSSLSSPILSGITFSQAGVYTLQYTVNGCVSALYSTRVEVIPLPKNIGESQAIPGSVSQGLQLHLPMDGNGNDVSGNGINATLVGGVAPMNNRFGIENAALQLNGSNGHLTLPAGVYFSGSDFTVTTWVRKDANNSWSRLFDFGNGQANQNVLVGLTNGTTGRPASQIYNGTVGGPTLTSVSVLPNNQWQMFTYTWSNGAGQLFINGELVIQGPQTTPENVIRNLNYIGRSNWSNDGFANAGLDEFRIYNRLLTPEEIRLMTVEQPSPLQVSLENAEVCSGQTNSIILQNTQPGLVYQLRLNSNASNVGVAQTGTGGTLTFSLGTLTATTAYHFLIRNTALACAELISTVISVPVNPLPVAPSTTGASVCSEGSVTLTATGAPEGGSYNWYLTATGGTSLTGETGSTFTTPVLLVTRTYYVSITNASGCESSRTPVIAEVINPFAPVIDLNSGLLLHSRLDGNLLDSSTNAINGGLNGSVFSYEEDRNGNESSALSITNGTFVDYGNPSVVQQLTNQVTISLWIKQDASNFGLFTPLLNKWQGNGMYLALDSYQTIPAGPMNENRVRWRVNNSVFINSNTNVLHNRWHHIVVTYNGAQLRIYQDGQLTGQLNHNGTITNNGANLQFGRQSNGLGNATYRGDVDEIKLYNRALSLNEVRTLFNNESVAFANTPLCDSQGDLGLTTLAFPGATYQWTGPNGFSSTEQNPTIIPQADAATYAGDYTLVVTNAEGCASLPQTVQVVIHPIPAAAEVQNATVCGSGNATLQVLNPPAGATFRWYTVEQGGTPIAGATSATLQLNNVTQETIRYVSVVQNNCEGPRVPVTAFYFSNVNTGLTVTGSSVCQSAETALVTLPQSESGVFYQVFLGTTAVSPLVTGTGVSIEIAVNATLLNLGINALTVRANFPNCGPVAMENQPEVIRLQVIQPAISFDGNLQICSGESIQLTASAGVSYLWSNGETTSAINVTQAGVFSVTVTDENGCQATSSSVTVTVNPNPTPAIAVNGSTVLCSGETTQLQASGGTTYLWSTGATTPTLTVSQAGTYSVTAFNGTCQATSSSVMVTVNPIPTPAIVVNGSTVLCSGETTQLQASGGTTYLWSTGATTPTLTVSQAGTYSVTAFNGTCQATSSSVTVTVNTIPQAPLAINGSTQLCANSEQNYSIAPVNGATSYQWILPQGWTGTSNSATIIVNSTSSGGQISVVAVNQCGESQQQVLTVEVTAVDTAVSQDGVQLAALATNASFQWYNCSTNQLIQGATDSIFTALVAGSYAVLVTQNGCSEFSDCFDVTPLSLPTNSFSYAIRAYPIPAQRLIEVKIEPSPQDKVELSVLNVLGQELRNEAPLFNQNGVYTLDVESLPDGNYFIKVKLADQHQVISFIKR
ncbi:putative secreted protein (Por secretion system target) [Flavobacterium lacus]|uniref:Putative secreted protein (Por secretion system target) n=2 Tax=Flavobacterium lacus TaxID=1353778 RepID=A0A328WLN7_9FLAO|nr:putative secreted protein (Por secretion system target) [Flavobacterium lacus]